ncbi:MAG: hypothetical protein ACI865_002928 [Flavobacteriaceae bacterium]
MPYAYLLKLLILRIGMKKIKWVLVGLVAVNIGVISTLIFVKINAEEHLELAAQHLEQLGMETIEHTVHVNTIIPFDTEIMVLDPIEVEIELTIDEYIHIKANIPVKDIIQVPINMRVKENIELDTTIRVMEKLNINLDTKIPIDQTFLIPRGKKGKGINIPIRASIPVNQNVQISFNDPMKVKSTIAIDIPVQQTLDVEFQLDVPMDQSVPMRLPLKTTAIVTFRQPMKVTGEIPIVLDIPVVIPLSTTPIKNSMERVASELRKILPF